MSSILNLFRKQSQRSPAISRPILQYTDASYDFDSNDFSKNTSEIRTTEVSPDQPRAHSNHRFLLSVYAAITLLSLTATIIFSIAIPLWNKNFIHRQSPIKTDWSDTLVLVPLSLSIVSSTYLFARPLCRRQQRSRHIDPFNLILLSSTIVLSLVPVLILVSNNTLAHAFSHTTTDTTSHEHNTNTTSSNNQSCTLNNILTRPCLPILYRIGELQVGGLVLASLVGLAWTVILLLSSWNLLRSRAEERRRRETARKQKHARRRGYERKHVHGHNHGSHSRRHGGANNNQKANIEGVYRHAARVHGRTRLSVPWEDSNAVQYTRHTVKPKESIQMWLSDRRA